MQALWVEAIQLLILPLHERMLLSELACMPLDISRAACFSSMLNQMAAIIIDNSNVVLNCSRSGCNQVRTEPVQKHRNDSPWRESTIYQVGHGEWLKIKVQLIHEIYSFF